MGNVQERIKELGITLPEKPVPVANYVGSQNAGELIYLSGQTSRKPGGGQLFPGKVGKEVSVQQAYQAARSAALRLVGELADQADLDQVKIIRITGYVNAVEGFAQQPAVINGASDLIVELFGDNGKHARSAIGVGSLPENASVEVEMIAQRM